MPLSPMPFPKGWNKWALPQDTMDAESTKLAMVSNSLSLLVFRELFLPGELADMDYNDIMASKSRSVRGRVRPLGRRVMPGIGITPLYRRRTNLNTDA